MRIDISGEISIEQDTETKISVHRVEPKIFEVLKVVGTDYYKTEGGTEWVTLGGVTFFKKLY